MGRRRHRAHPSVGKLINPFDGMAASLAYLPSRALQPYCPRQQVQARIKISQDLTPEVYAQQVDEQWQLIKDGPDTIAGIR